MNYLLYYNYDQKINYHKLQIVLLKINEFSFLVEYIILNIKKITI
jgi:hypothetical protein